MPTERRIERIESQTLDGLGVIRLYFHSGVKISEALAQSTAISQAILRRMPPGGRTISVECGEFRRTLVNGPAPIVTRS